MIHCLEGGHSLNSGPGTTTQRLLANLEHYFRRGVAYLTLAHFFENDLVHPCFPWPENIQKLGFFRSERDVTGASSRPASRWWSAWLSWAC
jgi:hypothetical protein